MLTALIVVASCALYIVPIVRILRRAGRSGWWSLLFFSGPFMIVGLWTFAYCRWPSDDHRIASQFD